MPLPARWGLSWAVFWSDQWSRNGTHRKAFFGRVFSQSDITAVLQCFLFSHRSISCWHCNVVALKILLCVCDKTCHISQTYTQSCYVMKSAGWTSFEVVDSTTSLEEIFLKFKLISQWSLHPSDIAHVDTHKYNILCAHTFSLERDLFRKLNQYTQSHWFTYNFQSFLISHTY